MPEFELWERLIALLFVLICVFVAHKNFREALPALAPRQCILFESTNCKHIWAIILDYLGPITDACDRKQSDSLKFMVLSKQVFGHYYSNYIDVLNNRFESYGHDSKAVKNYPFGFDIFRKPCPKQFRFQANKITCSGGILKGSQPTHRMGNRMTSTQSWFPHAFEKPKLRYDFTHEYVEVAAVASVHGPIFNTGYHHLMAKMELPIQCLIKGIKTGEHLVFNLPVHTDKSSFQFSVLSDWSKLAWVKVRVKNHGMVLHIKKDFEIDTLTFTLHDITNTAYYRVISSANHYLFVKEFKFLKELHY